MEGIKPDEILSYNDVDNQIKKIINETDDKNLSSLTDLNSEILAYAKSTDVAKMSVEDFYATQVKSTTGVLGAIKAIKTYNNISEEDTATRKAYAQAVGNVNANLGKQMTNLNGANASIGTYAKSIASATLKTVSLNAATLALNAAFSFGLTAAVQGVINLAQKLWKLVPTANHVKEAAEKITEAYVSQRDEIEQNASTINDLKEEFTELSKGVDSNGKNISLSTDEYSRYKSIVEELIKINPNLIQGYNDEHEAIINNNDAIEETIELLKKKNRLAAADYVSDENIEAVSEDAINKIEDANSLVNKALGDYYTAVRYNTTPIEQAVSAVVNESNITSNEAEQIQGFYDKWLKYDNFGINDHDTITDLYQSRDEYILDVKKLIDSFKALDEDFDTTPLSNMINDIDESVSKVEKAYDELDTACDGIIDLLQNVPESMKEYSDLSNNEQDFISQWISKFRVDANTTTEDILAAKNEIRNFVKEIADEKNNQGYYMSDIIDGIFSLDKSQLSIQEYQKQIDEYIAQLIDSSLGKKYGWDSDSVKVMLGFAFETDDSVIQDNAEQMYDSVLKKVYSAFGTKISAESITEMGEMLRSLTVEELTTLSNTDLSKFNTLSEAISDALNLSITNGKFNPSAWIEENSISNLESEFNTLKSALNSLDEGKSLDFSFFKEFPDLAVYSKDAEKLREEIEKIPKFKTAPLIAQLSQMLTKTTSKKDQEVLKTWISIIQDMSNLDNVDIDINLSSIEKSKSAIESKIDSIDKTIDRLEDEKSAQESILNTLQQQKEQLENIVSNYETAASTVTSAIDEEISALEEQRSLIEDKYNSEIKALQSENEERDRNIELREKELALDKAKNTKVRVYDSARGFTIQTDTEAVKKAQEELDDFKTDINISELEKQRDSETAVYDERIKEYEDYKKSWEDVVDSYKKAQNDLTTASILGSDWRESIYNKDTGVLNSFADNYSYFQDRLHNVIEPQITDVQNIVSAYENQINIHNDLKTAQENFLSFYTEYSNKFSELTNQQTEAVKRLNEAINNGNAAGILAGASQVGVTSVITGIGGSYADGGVIDYTGIAKVHGTKSRPEIVFNAAQAQKLYELVMNNPGNYFRDQVADNIASQMRDSVNNISNVSNRNVSNNSYTWAITGNNMKVDNYDEFKGYMDRYVREARMNLIIGKR